MTKFRFGGALFGQTLFDGEVGSGPVTTEDDIVYNDYGLQNASIITQFSKVSAPTMELNLRAFPRANGNYAESAYFRKNVIRLQGTLKADTQTALETLMDELREALSVSGGTLKINWAGVRRIYENCYPLNIEGIFQSRDHYNVTWVDYAIDFVSLEPFARANSRENFSAPANQTTTPVTYTIPNSGTAKTKSIVYLTITTVGTLSALSWYNTTTGEKVSLTGLSLSNGDIIAISGEDVTVLKNGGTALDYTGIIPSLAPGDNSIQLIVDTGASYSIGVSEVHYPRYL